MSRKIIITGGTCSGKSTLIEELSRRGYKTLPEAARTVIKREQEKERSKDYKGIFPWTNLSEFQRLVLAEQIDLESRISQNSLIFLDRSLIDALAFYEEGGLVVPDISEAIVSASYEQAFFLQSIPSYKKDDQRKEDHSRAIRLREIHLKHYAEQNFPFTFVPAWSVERRADFLIQYIGGDNGLY